MVIGRIQMEREANRWNQAGHLMNGIMVHGEKIPRTEPSQQEDSSVNFSGSSKSNVGKWCVYLYREDVFGRILSQDELGCVLQTNQIIGEDADALIVGSPEKKEGFYLMKYPELYSFFRIVDSEEELNAVIAMIENYTQHLFSLLDEKWPFDIDMLGEFKNTLDESFDGDISMETQKKVLNKLQKTESNKQK